MVEKAKSSRLLWIGRAASALVVAALLMDASVQFFFPDLAASMLRDGGFAPDLAPALGTIMVACAILYAIPLTAFLGAVLTTGFLGGAICAHVRLGEAGSPPELISLLLGLLAWGGLYLRHRLPHPLFPIRREPIGRVPTSRVQPRRNQTSNIRTST